MRLPITVTRQIVNRSLDPLSSAPAVTVIAGETVIIELQGRLEVSCDDQDEDHETLRPGLEIGKLDISDPVSHPMRDMPMDIYIVQI